jgi:hypothetical protein
VGVPVSTPTPIIGLDRGLGISLTGAMRASRGSDVQPAAVGGLVFRADNVTIGDDYSLH